MKAKFIIISMVILVIGSAVSWYIVATAAPISKRTSRTSPAEPEKGCVFKTVFGEQSIDSGFRYKTPAKVSKSVEEALKWLSTAQLENGGWGAGTHANQQNMDPHNVQADPATTAMVAMSLLRSGNTLETGKYSVNLKKALHFLFKAVDNSANNPTNITEQTGTQIQVKLGGNIDVILAAQFFSNILNDLDNDAATKKNVKEHLDVCVKKIQKAQDHDGSFKGGGWAGVLQSGLANTALESAYYNGAHVDTAVMNKSRDYQQGNYNVETQEVNVERGAGVVLYSVSQSTRAASKEARKAKELIDKGKKSGKLDKDAKVTKENLQKMGETTVSASKYEKANDIYNSAKVTAQSDAVTRGFGNNGGEEFMSFLQTGESLIVAKDISWKKWYDNVSGTLLSIQNNDGTWNGHHCITSPVFCTATCVMVLSVDNDIDQLLSLGAK